MPYREAHPVPCRVPILPRERSLRSLPLLAFAVCMNTLAGFAGMCPTVKVVPIPERTHRT